MVNGAGQPGEAGDQRRPTSGDGRGDRNRSTWMAFLAVAFAVVGLTGIFGTYAAPLPLQRALAREAALDDALTAAHMPQPQSGVEVLRPRLAESAEAVLPLSADEDARIAGERAAMRARFIAEAEAEGKRLRLMIGVVTVMGAVFGAVVLNWSRAA
jgi:hypothetical protein